MTVGERVEFRQPLIRSAVYHVADASERRAAHCALAEAVNDAERARRLLAAVRALWLGGDSGRAAALLDGLAERVADPLLRADIEQVRCGALMFARAALRAALDYFQTNGLEPWAEQARAELRASGEKSAPSDGSLRSLTPQELQIALTVAGGATTARRRPRCSERETVEFHLSNAYRKLGLRSHAELVRRVEGLP